MEMKKVRAMFVDIRGGLKRAAACLIVCLSSSISPAHAAADEILVLRSPGPKFEETVNGLRHELGGDFQCRDWILRPGLGEAEFAADIARTRPKAIVLMDNEAIQLYARVQGIWHDTVPFPPSISLMAIRVDKAIAGMKRATGIFYEVPGVTTLMNLRSLVAGPVRKVGVIVRPSMRDFVDENAKWCKYENIELVPFEVPEESRDIAKSVRTGVRRLRNKENVDALWILNDNFFLTPDIIENGWLPALERFRKPVLVGVENLVSTRIRFGTFATLPDHYGLGVQAAGMILRLKEDGWEMDGPQKVEQPLAVYKILNLVQAMTVSDINQAALMEIDKVIR
jgi:hypothetical protein